MDIQARIPAGLCTLHNFVNSFNSDVFYHPDFDLYKLMQQFDEQDLPIDGDDHDEHIIQDGNETGCAGLQCNMITQAMWDDYLAE